MGERVGDRRYGRDGLGGWAHGSVIEVGFVQMRRKTDGWISM